MSGDKKINYNDEINGADKPVETLPHTSINEHPHIVEIPLDVDETVESTVLEEHDDEDLDSPREGFSVYEPPHTGLPQPDVIDAEETAEDEVPDEWDILGDGIYAEYGDSLDGTGGYMGPVGILLTVIGGAIIAITAGFENAGNVISRPVLLGSAGAFIIGIFLLLFHLFHWLSNRAKAAAMAHEVHLKLLVNTCGYLDIESTGSDEDMVVLCKYFERELSEDPECLVCPHYTIGEPGVEYGFGVKNVEGDGVEALKKSGESGGDLDEEPNISTDSDINSQTGINWEEPKGNE